MTNGLVVLTGGAAPELDGGSGGTEAVAVAYLHTLTTPDAPAVIPVP